MIYFIKAESGHVKIGFTESNIEQRMISLRLANPLELTVLKVIEGDRRQERIIQEKFAQKRVRGEWFLLDQELEDYIISLKQPEPEPPFILPEKEENDALFLQACMDKNNITPSEMDRRTNVSRNHINLILKGVSSVGPKTALIFEKALGIPSERWVGK